MRTMKLVLVLLALSVFIGATVAMASAATPAAIGVPGKQMSMPAIPQVKMPAKMAAGSMMGGFEKFGQANDAATKSVKLEAAKQMSGVQNDIVRNFGKTSGMMSLPGMGPAASQPNSYRQMPALGRINMPDWTSPGIILTK